MNRIQFIDLCKGNFGRKRAFTSVDEITIDNVVGVVGDAVSVMNYNAPMITYLYEYYKGDQPVLYREKVVRPQINNRVCENHALEVVRFKTAQTYAEPIQYVCKRKNATEEKNEQIDKLNDYLDDAFSDARNIELGTWQSAVGFGYKAIMREPKWKKGSDEIPFKINILNPKNVIIVYSENDGSPMLSVERFKDIEGDQCFRCYSDHQYFIVKNGQVIAYGSNGFDGIPIVEFPNNGDRLSDIEIGISLLDTINEMQSNRMDGIQQFVQSLMKFKNCEIDENKFLDMVRLGAISVKDIGAGLQSDVDIMTAELNQTETQVAKDDIYKNFLIIEGMPSRDQKEGGQTGQAVYLRNGWDFAEQRAHLDEPFTKEAEKRCAKLILNIISKTTNDINVSVRDFEVSITRNPTDNMLVKAQALDYLFKNKIHPLIALITCGLFSDPQKVYEMSYPYLKSLYPEIVDPDGEFEKAKQLLETKVEEV